MKRRVGELRGIVCYNKTSLFQNGRKFFILGFHILRKKNCWIASFFHTLISQEFQFNLQNVSNYRKILYLYLKFKKDLVVHGICCVNIIVTYTYITNCFSAKLVLTKNCQEKLLLGDDYPGRLCQRLEINISRLISAPNELPDGKLKNVC